MKMSQFQQYATVAVILIFGLVGAYYYFLIKPLDADITNLRSDLEEKQKKLEAAKQTLAKYDEFKKRAAAVQRELEWAQSRIPVQMDKTKFIDGINLIQARSKVVFNIFKFKGASSAGKDGTSEVQADIRFNATYDQLLKFLYEVSLSKNLMVIHDMKITTYNDPTGSPLSLTANMTLGGLQGKK